MQAFVAAGIGVVLMHGLALTMVPPGIAVRPLAERPAGSRTIEAVAPVAGRGTMVDDLYERLADAARAYALTRRGGAPSQP